MSHQIEDIGFVKRSVKMKRALWAIVCVFFFRPFGTLLFRRWRNFVLRCFGAELSYNTNIYASVKIWAPWNLKMASDSCLGPYVVCYNQALVTLEEGATVSQYSYICTAGHKTSNRNTADNGLIIAPVTIHKNAWIGTHAYINMGVEIGENSIVGATASVYKDVEPRAIVGGNPAKLIKMREFVLSGGGKNRLLVKFNQAHRLYKKCA